MKKKFGIDTDISVGQTGDFEVKVGGKAVFSKRGIGRFPDPGEVEGLVTQLLGK